MTNPSNALYVVSPESVAHFDTHRMPHPEVPEPAPWMEEISFAELLLHLHDCAGFDADLCDRSWLRYRIDTRMRAHGINSYADYLDLLGRQPAERQHLIDQLLSANPGEGL